MRERKRGGRAEAIKVIKLFKPKSKGPSIFGIDSLPGGLKSR